MSARQAGPPWPAVQGGSARTGAGASSPAREAGHGSRRRSSGLALAGGGVLWLGVGLVAGAGAAPVWIVADLLLLVGLVGLGRSGLHGRSRTGRLGLGTAVAGRVAFVVAEVLGAGQAEESALLPVAALLSAVGTTLYGAAVLSAGTWRGAGRWAPLACGAYPFAVMFPLVAAAGGEPSYPAIALWGATYAVLGAAVLRQSTRG